MGAEEGGRPVHFARRTNLRDGARIAAPHLGNGRRHHRAVLVLRDVDLPGRQRRLCVGLRVRARVRYLIFVLVGGRAEEGLLRAGKA